MQGGVPEIGAEVDSEAVEVTAVVGGVEVSGDSVWGEEYVVRMVLMTKMHTIRKALRAITRRR